MRDVCQGGAAIIVAAALFVVPGLAVGAEASPPDGRPEGDTLLFFAGYDLWRSGGFGHGGAVWSPDGLAKSGFLIKGLLGAGSYRYTTGGRDIRGTAVVGAVMPGLRFVHGPLDVSVTAGPDIQRHGFSPDDPGNELRGWHFGFRIGADLWWEPTAGSMVNASASVTTIGTGYWSRAAYGWRIFDRVYIGPELMALGDDDYRQFRLGAHATALRLGPVELSAGLGFVRDSERRSGPYGRIGVLARR